jgi:membrane protein insertase Oxa1/YidC/SpoIIIJ
VLKAIQTELDKLNVPYSYGYSIIILTAMVKLVTLPLTKKQVGFAGSSCENEPLHSRMEKHGDCLPVQQLPGS